MAIKKKIARQLVVKLCQQLQQTVADSPAWQLAVKHCCSICEPNNYDFDHQPGLSFTIEHNMQGTDIIRKDVLPTHSSPGGSPPPVHIQRAQKLLPAIFLSIMQTTFICSWKCSKMTLITIREGCTVLSKCFKSSVREFPQTNESYLYYPQKYGWNELLCPQNVHWWQATSWRGMSSRQKTYCE